MCISSPLSCQDNYLAWHVIVLWYCWIFCWGLSQDDLTLSLWKIHLQRPSIFPGAHPDWFFLATPQVGKQNVKGPLSEHIWNIPRSHTFKCHIYFSGIEAAHNRSKSRANTHSTLMTVSETQSDKLSYPHLVIIHTVESSQAWRKRASALNNPIFVSNINRLRFARSEDMARSILMNFSLKPNIDSRVFTESALAKHVSCGFTSCPVHFEGGVNNRLDWLIQHRT